MTKHSPWSLTRGYPRTVSEDEPYNAIVGAILKSLNDEEDLKLFEYVVWAARAGRFISMRMAHGELTLRVK